MHDSFTIRGNGEGYRNGQSSLLYVVLQDDGAKQQRDSYKTFTQSKKLKCTGVVGYAVESGNRGIYNRLWTSN